MLTLIGAHTYALRQPLLTIPTPLPYADGLSDVVEWSCLLLFQGKRHMSAGVRCAIAHLGPASAALGKTQFVSASSVRTIAGRYTF